MAGRVMQFDIIRFREDCGCVFLFFSKILKSVHQLFYILGTVLFGSGIGGVQPYVPLLSGRCAHGGKKI
jgi:hypothetical protein